MKKVLLSTVALLALAACTKPVAQAPTVQGLMTTEQYKLRSEAAADEANRVPKWYLELPEKKDSVFSGGTAISGDLQLSFDKAILSAKRVLADRIDGRMNSLTKTFMSELGQKEARNVSSQLTQVTKNVIANIDVTGYHVVKREIFTTGPMYRAYVQLEFPMAEHNRLMLSKLLRDEQLAARLSASKAFRELQNEVDSKRQETKDRLSAVTGGGTQQGVQPAPQSRPVPSVDQTPLPSPQG